MNFFNGLTRTMEMLGILVFFLFAGFIISLVVWP
jgi:hypothetical protein